MKKNSAAPRTSRKTRSGSSSSTPPGPSSSTALRPSRSPQGLPLAANDRPAALSDVLITSRLQSRRRRPDAQTENTALRNLARVMVEKPSQLIDTLLQAALELCEAGTAGLSVLDSGAQVYRWANLAGRLHSLVGRITPRNFSPCGVTTDCNSPQLFLYPGRRFQYFSSLEPPIVEALVLPVRLESEIPATIWIFSHHPRVHFDSEDVRIMTVLADFTANALRLLRSHADEKRERLASDKVVEAHEKTEVSMHKVQTGLRADLLERTDQLEHLSARLIVHQDEERRRLARELHDSAGQYLAAILMNLGAAQRETSPAEREAKLAECRTMTEACLAEIRTISYLLHPPLLDEMGLRTALSMYTEGFAERSGIAVELNIPETFERLPSASETALFRVVQQSLANIHRHSGSASARISISMDAQQVEVQICDDGVGIAAEKLLAFNAGRAILGVGMAGMRERMRDMGGRFLIESTEKGTTIHATLPVA